MLDNSISYLNLNEELQTIFLNHNINTIRDLWVLKRNDLKEMKISDSDINKIIIKLQLYGIDLNKKVYKKN